MWIVHVSMCMSVSASIIISALSNHENATTPQQNKRKYELKAINWSGCHQFEAWIVPYTQTHSMELESVSSSPLVGNVGLAVVNHISLMPCMWENHNLYNKRHINKLNGKMTWNLFRSIFPSLVLSYCFLCSSFFIHKKRLMGVHLYRQDAERGGEGWRNGCIEWLTNATPYNSYRMEIIFSLDWIPVIFMIIILHLSSCCIMRLHSCFLYLSFLIASYDFLLSVHSSPVIIWFDFFRRSNGGYSPARICSYTLYARVRNCSDWGILLQRNNKFMKYKSSNEIWLCANGLSIDAMQTKQLNNNNNKRP